MNYPTQKIIRCLLVLSSLLSGCCGFGNFKCDPAPSPCDYYCPCYDGKVPVSNISRWDGAQWLPLGSGVNGTVEGIITDSVAQELYVFGSFTNAGGVQVSNQAKWSEKTQTWSALGTELNHSSSSYVSNIVASNGKIYYCNHSSNKLYNSNRTFVDSSGLVVWDGSRWKMLLSKIEGRDKIDYLSVWKIIGTSLYISSLDYKDATGWDRRFYIYDVILNKIVDSLPDNISKLSSECVSIFPNGIFTAEGDGVYHYFNGISKKIMTVPTNNTGYVPSFIQISTSTEFVSYINQQNAGSLTFESTTIIYDIAGDSTFQILYTPINHASLHSSWISGHTLFIGGAYYLKDSSTDVRNIGAYDLREKKWYDLAGGVCGPVNAIAEMNGSIYVGGNFSTAGKK